MIAEIQALLAEVEAAHVHSAEELDAYKRAFTNKKARINTLFETFRTLPGEEKREVGQPLNQLKQRALARLKEFE